MARFFEFDAALPTKQPHVIIHVYNHQVYHDLIYTIYQMTSMLGGCQIIASTDCEQSRDSIYIKFNSTSVPDMIIRSSKLSKAPDNDKIENAGYDISHCVIINGNIIIEDYLSSSEMSKLYFPHARV